MLLIITFCASYLLLWQHSPAPSLIQIVCGLWMADFGGGLVHLYLDTFTAFHLPFLGPLAAEFQQHHKAPHEITRRTTLGLLTDTSVFSLCPSSGGCCCRCRPEAAGRCSARQHG